MKKQMIRAMCEIKLVEKKNSQELFLGWVQKMLRMAWPGQLECDGMGMFLGKIRMIC